MTIQNPRRLWGSAAELLDLLEARPGGMVFAVRDFALVTLACQLSLRFPDQLVFKGGFVLRHVHGILRFSKDIDATHHELTQRALSSTDVARAIEEASIRNVVKFDPKAPATDTKNSLDFDDVKVTGETFPASSVQVEISFREGVVDDPVLSCVGEPFYEQVEVLTMRESEMAAEKLRALAQRQRATDLADLAVLLKQPDVNDEDIARLAVTKFELVAAGRANREDRIEQRLLDLADSYDNTVPGLFPDAPTYSEAMSIVWPRVRVLVP